MDNQIEELIAERDKLTAEINDGQGWGAAKTAKYERLGYILKEIAHYEASNDDGDLIDVPAKVRKPKSVTVDDRAPPSAANTQAEPSVIV